MSNALLDLDRLERELEHCEFRAPLGWATVTALLAEARLARGLDERLRKLEAVTHKPFDFTDLVRRLERLEALAKLGGQGGA